AWKQPIPRARKLRHFLRNHSLDHDCSSLFPKRDHCADREVERWYTSGRACSCLSGKSLRPACFCIATELSAARSDVEPYVGLLLASLRRALHTTGQFWDRGRTAEEFVILSKLFVGLGHSPAANTGCEPRDAAHSDHNRN